MRSRLLKEHLDGQFIFVHQNQSSIPSSWKTINKGSWYLGTHPSLPVVDIRSELGNHLGWIIGYPISSTFEYCPKEFHFPFNTDGQSDTTLATVFESCLYEIGGRFAAIFLHDNFLRVYLDPLGSLPLVYSNRSPIVASTPSLIDDPPHNWDEELITELNMPHSDLWYPSGLTPKKHVSRLLPNHYLDLSDWQAVRHWPKESFKSRTISPDKCVRIVHDMVSKIISSVAKKYPIYLNLTAGRDTRTVLACARNSLERIHFFTFYPGTVTLDSQISQLLASRFDLHFTLLKEEKADEQQLNDWLFRTGHCIGGKVWQIHQTQRHLDPKRVRIPGLWGEISRAERRRKEDYEALHIDAKELLRRYYLPSSGKILSKTEKWLSEISHFDVFLIVDLMFLEQRMGCWGPPQSYGASNYCRALISPFSHRRIIESLLSLPREYRDRSQFTTDLCQYAWPELLRYPFNESPGLRGRMSRLRGKIRSTLKGSFKLIKP